MNVRLKQLLQHQAAVASLAQLERCGVTRRQLKWLVASGSFERVAPNVVALCGAPFTAESEALAGLLAMPVGTRLSHDTAAAIHGFDGFVFRRPLHFVTERSNRDTTPGWIVHSSVTLEEEDVALKPRALQAKIVADPTLREIGLVTDWPVTSPRRTVADLGQFGDLATVSKAVDSVVRDRMATISELADTAERLRPGRGWIRKLDRSLADAGGHSWLERHFLSVMRSHGLPRPQTQVIYADQRAGTMRVDFDFAPLNLIVEVSGRRGHSSDDDRRRDAVRRNALQRAGQTVLEFVTDQVRDHPAAVAKEVADAIQALSRFGALSRAESRQRSLSA